MEHPPPVPQDTDNPLANTTSGMAIGSLVLGIIGFLTGIIGIGLLLAIAGLILGIIAVNQIGKAGNPGKGKGLAIGGIVFSSLAIVLMPIALMIGILLPALGAARSTARQMASNTQARGIHQAMITHAMSQPADANGDRPMTADLGELLKGNFFTAEYTQSPMDSVGGDVPNNFYTLTLDEQADWVRQYADFVLVPGLKDSLAYQEIALFGKPDRFDGRGIPVARNDGSTTWETNIAQIEQDLLTQTGKTMAELIQDAEAMGSTP
ncbi:MAG: DUF4190 domain-containing protein [Planctomycetota bacterium]